MDQNRNKLIDLFVGNISNSVIHMILGKAVEEDNIREHYNKELSISLDVAKKYRAKINPKNTPLPERDIGYIKQRIAKKVFAELRLRISKGYQNIDLELVEPTVDKLLSKTSVIWDVYSLI